MYYKVMKDGKVIDVLDHVTYLKWQPKHGIMILSDENEAQAILSSDNNTIWHEASLYRPAVSQFDTVEMIEINEYEYKQLKVLNGKTPEEIIDSFMLSLLENNIV